MLNGLGNAIGQIASDIQSTRAGLSNAQARLLNVDNASVAERYVTRFDRDGDSAIDVASETNRSTWLGLRHQSIDRLAGAADRMGDRDGKATRTELEDLLKTYDTGAGFATGGDNFLELRERRALLDTHGPTSGFGGGREADVPEPAGPAPGGDVASIEPGSTDVAATVDSGPAAEPDAGDYSDYGPYASSSYAEVTGGGQDVPASVASGAVLRVDPAFDVRGFDVVGAGPAMARSAVSAAAVADAHSAQSMKVSYPGPSLAYGRRIPGDELMGSRIEGRRIPGDELAGSEIGGRRIPGNVFDGRRVPGRRIPGGEIS